MSVGDDGSVRHEVLVGVGAEQAFATFARLDAVKPREHNLLDVPIEETVLEPRVGGAVYDRGTDGSTCRWARVLVYDPPRALVLSWDIDPDWQVTEDLAATSEVEVTFTPEGPERTRVRLVHRHLDRHGRGWEALSGGLDADGGWPLWLARLDAACAAGTP